MHRGAPEVHRDAAIQARPAASKLLLGNRSFMKTFKVLSWYTSAALLIGTLAHADVVTEWNSAGLDAIRDGHTPPPIASRSLSIVRL